MKVLATLAIASFAAAAAAAPTTDDAPFGKVAGTPIENKYIVTLKPEANQQAFTTQLQRSIERENAREGNSVQHTLDHEITIADFKGYVGTFSKAFVDRLKKSDAIANVEQDTVVTALGTQANPPSWGLSRVSSRTRGATSYVFPDTAGAGATVYVIDTGVNVNHVDFSGRARMGWKAEASWPNNDDNGHGTHCAGTVAGTSYGVAKRASIVGVKVLSGSGSGSNAGVIAGINWVAQQARNAGKTVVASMSLGGGKSSTTNSAVAAAVRAGVAVIVAAGNESQDACNVSPASEPSAVTVGSTTSSDALSSFSNFGRCVDILAPGSSITSAWIGSTTAKNTISGTSMATPHVSGAAALLLGANPSLTPAQIASTLTSRATANVITGVRGSPNRLLYTR